MAGFTGLDDILNAGTVNQRAQHLLVDKYMPSVSQSSQPFSYWDATGLPSAGSNPSAGVGTAVTTDSSTVGAIPFTNASGGRTMHLISATAGASPVGSYMLVDRLAHMNIANDQATAAFSPVLDGTARLASGEGAMIFCEVTTALSAASNSRTFTYTNQAGTGGQATPAWASVASAPVRRVPYASSFFVPLAAGDTGVRSIESTTLTINNGATGNYNICLVKPIAVFGQGVASGAYDYDYVWSNFALPRIRDGACLFFIELPNTTTQGSLYGRLTILEN